MTQVETLKKIILSFQAGTSPDVMDLIPEHPEFSFIFAIAPEGMTPFEYELAGKSEGDSVRLHLKKETCNQFFEHLYPPFGDLWDGRDAIYLQIEILEITAADNREIIKAMADMTAHGGRGCDCDCGCGCE